MKVLSLKYAQSRKPVVQIVDLRYLGIVKPAATVVAKLTPSSQKPVPVAAVKIASLKYVEELKPQAKITASVKPAEIKKPAVSSVQIVDLRFLKTVKPVVAELTPSAPKPQPVAAVSITSLIYIAEAKPLVAAHVEPKPQISKPVAPAVVEPVTISPKPAPVAAIPVQSVPNPAQVVSVDIASLKYVAKVPPVLKSVEPKSQVAKPVEQVVAKSILPAPEPAPVEAVNIYALRYLEKSKPRAVSAAHKKEIAKPPPVIRVEPKPQTAKPVVVAKSAPPASVVDITSLKYLEQAKPKTVAIPAPKPQVVVPSNPVVPAKPASVSKPQATSAVSIKPAPPQIAAQKPQSENKPPPQPKLLANNPAIKRAKSDKDVISALRKPVLASQVHEPASSASDLSAYIPDDSGQSGRLTDREPNPDMFTNKEPCISGQEERCSDDETAARNAFSDGDYAHAASLARSAAQKGQGWGQEMLGEIYQNGLGGMRDVAEAARLYRKAANRKAKYKLGMMYCEGELPSGGGAECVSWLRKSAEADYVPAQSELARLYSKGELGISDEEGVKWAKQAAVNGDVNAAFILGSAYESGRGVVQDKTRALRWYIAVEKSSGANAARAKALVKKLIAEQGR